MEHVNDSTTSAMAVVTRGEQLTTTEGQEPDEDVYEFYSRWLFMVALPIITVVGVVGNGLSAVVMNRPSMRSSSIAVFITGLAITDSLTLILDFINNWVESVTGTRIVLVSRVVCSLYKFAFNTANCCSAWFVVFLSVERLIIICFPLKVRVICSRKKSIIASVVLPLFLSVVYWYHLVAWEIDENGKCNIKAKYDFIIGQVHPWMLATFYCYAPVTILIISTTVLVIQLNRIKSARKEITSQQNNTAKNENKITVMVIVICILFMLLTTPLTAFYVIVYNAGLLVYMGPELELYKGVILILALSNHAINFLLYAVTSSNFREELRTMCGGNKVSRNTNQSEDKKIKHSDPTGSTNYSNHI